MRLPINKILIGGFLIYICYEVYGLYKFCQPPHLPVGTPDAAVWDLKDVGALDIRVLLSMTDKMPKLPLPSGDKPSASSSHVFVGEFKSVLPAEAASLPDVSVKNLTLPRKFYKNGTVYLHVLAVSDTRIWRHSAVKISRHVLQADRREPTRYLLTEPHLQDAAPAKPVSSLPQVIEVGFLQETEPLNATVLQEKGLQAYVETAQCSCRCS